jgi:hypothetical protein
MLRRRWRLAIVIRTIHRRNEPAKPGFEPVERALDGLVHFRNHILGSLVISPDSSDRASEHLRAKRPLTPLQRTTAFPTEDIGGALVGKMPSATARFGDV